MTRKSKVDPDTGLTPQEVQDFWKDKPTAEQLGLTGKSEKQAKTKTKQPRKLARKPDAAVKDIKQNDLKDQAVALYKAGKTAKDVAATLSITYANAYYYKRFVKNEKADARMQEALARV